MNPDNFPETRVQREIGLSPHRYRQDAYQEAWVAFLEGRNPMSGIWAYIRCERRHESREVSASRLASGRPAGVSEEAKTDRFDRMRGAIVDTTTIISDSPEGAS